MIIKDLGDLNEDGYDDVMVSGSDLGQNTTGHAYVLHGGPTGIGTQYANQADLIFTSPASGTCFGSGIAGGRDINNDGYNDFVVTEACIPRVNIYLGTETGWTNTPDLTFTSSGANSCFYTKLMDLDQDYYYDLILGYYYNNNLSSAVYVVYGKDMLQSGNIENIYDEVYSENDMGGFSYSDGAGVFIDNNQKINLAIPNYRISSGTGKVSFYNTCRLYDPEIPLKMLTDSYEENENDEELTEEQVENFKLYPNPNDGSFALVCETNEEEVAKVNIYDLRGVLVESHFLNSNEKYHIIKNNNLSTGIYFVKLTVNNSVMLEEKIAVINQ